MVSLIAKSKLRKFRDTKLKTSYHFDKTDINNLKFSEFIENMDSNELNKKIKQIIKKYILKAYKPFYREELDEKYDFSNMEFLYLLKFYKDGWNLMIPHQELYFPDWTFTYNLEPLQKLINTITSHAYDKLEPNLCKWYLNESHDFSSLEVTYLLHYFVLLYEKEKTN
jgi:hypothetical protein